MSPKTQPKDPRASTIQTRRKVAQQRRQLRDIDRSMKSITQLLKSPTRTQTQKKAKASPKKTPKKKSQPEPVDEVAKPVARRRNVYKQWLKPTPNFKMVAKTNKRKLCTPRRELGPLPIYKPEIPASPDSLDMKQLVDDTDSLDEEDLMEILTCPSPVWWEEHPDLGYSEKPIYTRSQITPEKVKHKTKEDIALSEKDSGKQDPKFVKKRKKLENILGNIKNRKNIDNDGDKLDADLLNDDMLKSLENIDIPIEPAVKNEKQINKIATEVKVKKEEESNDVSKEIKTKLDDKVEIKNVKALVVPENLPPLQRNPMHAKTVREKNKMARDNAIKIMEKHDFIQNSSNIDSVLDKRESAKKNSENYDTDLDTISDTNVKFIDKVEDKELDDTSQMILDKIKKFFQEKKEKQKEYITVYKIVDNEDNQEIKNDDQSKINYFYKKCKNVRKKSDNKDLFKNSGKTLALPNSEVKYCFKCSSIFETKECHYCAMSETKECVCENSHEIRSDSTCLRNNDNAVQ